MLWMNKTLLTLLFIIRTFYTVDIESVTGYIGIAKIQFLSGAINIYASLYCARFLRITLFIESTLCVSTHHQLHF